MRRRGLEVRGRKREAGEGGGERGQKDEKKKHKCRDRGKGENTQWKKSNTEKKEGNEENSAEKRSHCSVGKPEEN